MRNSTERSTKVTLTVFLAKMRLRFNNRVLACLFHLESKRTASRIFHQVREALKKSFVPLNLGLEHITPNAVLNSHQTLIANKLFTNEPGHLF